SLRPSYPASPTSVRSLTLMGSLTRASTGLRHRRDPAADLQLTADISDIYPFGSKRLFHKGVEVFLLLACTYGALYFANFCLVAQRTPHLAPAAAHLLMLAPAACYALCMGRVVRTASLLLALGEIQPGIIAKVVEETIDTQKMAAKVAEKMRGHIRRLGGDPSTSKDLLVFFEQYALRPDGELGPREFRYALHCMHVHLSDARFRRLFKHFDLSKSGTPPAEI
ncbi:unnamed protein product, partial [Heterosigma akashiwo]